MKPIIDDKNSEIMEWAKTLSEEEVLHLFIDRLYVGSDNFGMVKFSEFIYSNEMYYTSSILDDCSKEDFFKHHFSYLIYSATPKIYEKYKLLFSEYNGLIEAFHPKGIRGIV